MYMEEDVEGQEVLSSSAKGPGEVAQSVGM